MNWKSKFETKLENFSDFIFDNKIKVIATTLLIVLALATQLKNITFDTSTDGFLHKNDSHRVAYDNFKEEFGKDEKVLITIESNNIFTIEFFKKLQAFHKDLEKNVPYITGVNSLINARDTKGVGDTLVVDDLFETLPSNNKQMQEKKKIILNSTLFKNLLINEQQNMTSIIIDLQTYTSVGQENADEASEDGFEDEEENTNNTQNKDLEYLSDAENFEIIKKARKIISKYNSPDFKISIAGASTITADLKSSMQSDMKKFVRMLILVVIIFLAILFRRISGVVAPMLIVILSLIVTISAMGATGTPITIVTQILPSFLLAVMIGACVHLLAVFYKEYDKTKDKKASLRYAMGHSGLAIIMTSATTAVGLFSFSFSGVAPIGSLGLFSSLGVLIGLAFTLILLPALLSLFNIKAKEIKTKDSQSNIMDKSLLWVADFSTNYAKSIILISSIIIITIMFFASKLEFSHNPIKWLAPTNELRLTIEKVDAVMKGSSTLEILVDTGIENGLYEPKILKSIEAFSKEALNIKSDKYYIGKVVSIVDILKESNRALNENKQEFYSIPDNKKLIAQELFLFENSSPDDLKDFVDTKFSKARLTLKVPNIDAIYYDDMIKEIKTLANKHFDKNIQVSTTGLSALLSRVMSNAIYSSAVSYAMAIVFISLLMILLLGSVKLGLISMIPNIAPLLMMTSVMVVFNMPLDMFTMLIGAIALGLAVDDTVHFMHNFRRYEIQYGNVQKAVEMTLLTTGRAMLVTSIVLTAGFLVFLGSSMTNLFNFGILTAIAINIALIADFFLVPAIMQVIIKNKKDVE